MFLRHLFRKKETAGYTNISDAETTSASANSDASVGDMNNPAMASELTWLVTAAIDFGTSNSGFAFVFEDNTDIHINKWTVGSSEKDKTPTTVLLKKDKSFHSFGFDAESDYARLCNDEEQKGWRYFHHFKMALYKKISKYTKIYDTENKPMPALEVLSIVIGHLKQEILKAVRIQRNGISDDDVMYVITVPAIWSDAAKQFMREAATHKTVGIQDVQLRLVLEPEAASVYCAQRRTERCEGSSDRQQFQPLSEGQMYVIVDIGGGTLDFATHEIIPVPGNRLYNQLLERCVARGNDMGGQYFNRKCLEFLESLFGKDCFEKWKRTKCDDFLDLERTIEDFKRKVSVKEDDVRLKVDRSLETIYKETSGGKSIEDFGSLKEFSSAIKSSKDGCIVLKNAFLRNFLEQIAVSIESYLIGIINELSSVKTIFLVGGLAKSTFVRQYIESHFPQCAVIVPEDAGVAVLKGAVLLGNRPQTIVGRIARYSYGIHVAIDFLEGTHSEENKFVRDGKVLCRNVFNKLIDKGQVLQYGQRFTTTTKNPYYC